MHATLSMVGLYNWDNTLFDSLQLPSGVERDAVVSAILLDSAELEVLYPDPEYMKFAIGNYSKRRIDTWTKLYKTTTLEYNPIWNKDGTITETEEVSRTGDTSGKSNTTTTSNGESSGNSETDTYVFGFNESNGAQSGRTTESGASNSSGNSTENGTSSENRRDDEKRTYTRNEQGNIGVTTTQQMIKEEREVDDFSIIDYIAKDILHKMCILVY